MSICQKPAASFVQRQAVGDGSKAGRKMLGPDADPNQNPNENIINQNKNQQKEELISAIAMVEHAAG